MHSLPKELQFGVISADWSGLRFALTCSAFADYVRENAEALRKKYMTPRTINTANKNCTLLAVALPNGLYYGYSLLFWNEKPFGFFKYKNNKMTSRFWDGIHNRVVFTHQNGHIKYECSRGNALSTYDNNNHDITIRNYDANSTEIVLDSLILMWTAGCRMRLEATYQYKEGVIVVEIEWGELKVNVRVCVKFRDVELNEEFPHDRENRACTYTCEQRDDLWIDENTPNWMVLREEAERYFSQFISDEEVEWLTYTEVDEDVVFTRIRTMKDEELPPGIGCSIVGQ